MDKNIIEFKARIAEVKIDFIEVKINVEILLDGFNKSKIKKKFKKN